MIGRVGILLWHCNIRNKNVIKTMLEAVQQAYGWMSYSLRAIQHSVCSGKWIIDKLLLFEVATAATACLDHCKLTVDSEALCGSLGADKVAGSTRVLPGITPSCWADNQRATRDGDPGVGSDGCASFAPLDCNLCPSCPCTPQRYISPLHRYCGNRQTDPGHCIYREGEKNVL